MIYNFMITEHLRKSVRVEAEDYEDAYSRIVDAINSEAIVLSADDFADRDIETIDQYERSQGGTEQGQTNDPAYSVDVDLTEEGEAG